MSAPLQSEWWSFERYGKKGEGAMARIERTIEQLGLSAIKTPKSDDRHNDTQCCCCCRTARSVNWHAHMHGLSIAHCMRLALVTLCVCIAQARRPSCSRHG